MLRSSPLRVERLEDRCVPAPDPLDLTVPAVIESAPAEEAVVDATAAPADATSVGDTEFVIDVYLIDPNDPSIAQKPVDTSSDAGSSWGDQEIVPPIDNPIWN